MKRRPLFSENAFILGAFFVDKCWGGGGQKYFQEGTVLTGVPVIQCH